jgi:hypothetical protein
MNTVVCAIIDALSQTCEALMRALEASGRDVDTDAVQEFVVHLSVLREKFER